MPVRSDNMYEKALGQSHSTTVSAPSWWTSDEQQMQLSLSKNVSFKVESPPQQYHKAKQLGFQLPGQESPSTQLIGQSHNEVVSLGRDESNGKNGAAKMKTSFTMNTREIAFDTSQSDHSHSATQTPPLYPYPEPFAAGVFASYGSHALIPAVLDPQMGMTAARVPLPLDISADGPIYVNAKQYHGILRRRQSRAKLEAQNKLVKARKPYLHESRHRHALNRVRGSGGRFLSTKKNPSTIASETANLHTQSDTLELELERCHSATSTYSDITSVSNSNIIFGQQQPDRRFSSHIGGRSGMQSNSQIRASVVR